VQAWLPLDSGCNDLGLDGLLIKIPSPACCCAGPSDQSCAAQIDQGAIAISGKRGIATPQQDAAECSKNAAKKSQKSKSPLKMRAKCLIILVGRQRFELWTYGLRVRCSTN
jgi:hypothetical protein